jgi:anionic cell wall polymer biosynthesis LytR-Cps2A-Psr (LCP) family protein
LGGINVTVPAPIAVDPIGKGNTVFLEAKDYLLDGPTALAYARARHTEGGDFDRAQRQQHHPQQERNLDPFDQVVPPGTSTE